MKRHSELPTPMISVIIPTFNRANILLRTLTALCEQDMPLDQYEVVVADDGSSDATQRVVEEFSNGAPVRIEYSWDSNQGANAARNRAIARARGHILVIINDDTVPIQTFLSCHAALHHRYPQQEVAALGRMTISPEVPYSLFTECHLDAWFAQFTNKQELGWKGFVTCNLSVKRTFLEAFGMFEEGLRWHEDIELGERLSRHGLRVFYLPEALGYHLHHLREKDFLGVAEREGRALADWYFKAPSLASKMAQVGLHTHASASKRLLYRVADAMLNAWTFPYCVQVARILTYAKPETARMIYLKLYQSRKRRATRARLGELGMPSRT